MEDDEDDTLSVVYSRSHLETRTDVAITLTVRLMALFHHTSMGRWLKRIWDAKSCTTKDILPILRISFVNMGLKVKISKSS